MSLTFAALSVLQEGLSQVIHSLKFFKKKKSNFETNHVIVLLSKLVCFIYAILVLITNNYLIIFFVLWIKFW